MVEKLLTDREVADILGVSKATIWRWIQSDKLPQPIKLGERCTRWRASELFAFIEAAAQ